ncbi:MAG: hypothetical protein HC915_04835 [Anaerolineae bacterium]|nr:hypothetical protein [Anaerolineae bacterium]
MFDQLKKWLGNAPSRPPTGPEPLTAEHVDFNLRVYWTKMTLNWNAEQRAAARQQAQTRVQAPDFQDNLMAKQYNLPLEGIPETAHSGASLLALLAVLDALETFNQESE